MLEAAGTLWVEGAVPSLAPVLATAGRARVELPTYPFQRRRLWTTRAAPSAPEAEPGIFYSTEWPVAGPAAPSAADAGAWLIDGSGPLARPLARAIEARGGRVIVHAGLEPADLARLVEASQPRGGLAGVVHLAMEGATVDERPASAAAVLAPCTRALRIVQALLGVRLAHLPRLWLVTRGAQAVGGRGPVSAAQAALWGLGRTLAHEASDLWGGLIDLDPGPAAAAEVEAAAMAADLLGAAPEDQLAYRDGRRHVARLSPLRPADEAVPVRPDALYLVTGGTGDVGFVVARHLAATGARHLALVSRRSPPPAHAAEIEALRGGGVTVHVFEADVAHRDDVARVFRAIGTLGVPLRGVVHAAGVLTDGTLARQDAAQLAAAFAPKVAGALNLEAELGRELRASLDFWVAFSSAAAVLGSAGQASYAAANAALAALAEQWRRAGWPSTAVHWGPWRGLGFARHGAMVDRLAAAGIGALDPEEAAALTLRLPPSPAVLALPLDRDALRRAPVAGPYLLRVLAGTSGAEDRLEDREWERLPVPQRAAAVRRLVDDHVRQVLRYGDGRAIDPDRGFFEMGMDSLMAVDLKIRLEADLGLPLRPTVAFDHPSLRELAAFLVERRWGAEEAPAHEESAAPRGAVLVAAPAPPRDTPPDVHTAIAHELARLEGLL